MMSDPKKIIEAVIDRCLSIGFASPKITDYIIKYLAQEGYAIKDVMGKEQRQKIDEENKRQHELHRQSVAERSASYPERKHTFTLGVRQPDKIVTIEADGSSEFAAYMSAQRKAAEMGLKDYHVIDVKADEPAE